MKSSWTNGCHTILIFKFSVMVPYLHQKSLWFLFPQKDLFEVDFCLEALCSGLLHASKCVLKPDQKLKCTTKSHKHRSPPACLHTPPNVGYPVDHEGVPEAVGHGSLSGFVMVSALILRPSDGIFHVARHYICSHESEVETRRPKKKKKPHCNFNVQCGVQIG